MRRLLSVLCLSFGFMPGAQDIEKPFASFWYPNDLLQWQPASDPAAPFNVSNVHLSKRFIDRGTTLNYDQGVPGITGLFSTHPTSNHSAQGFTDHEHYAFPYWAYLDYFVQWGGSATEGLIVPPVVPWTEAAHRNGVQVLGTVFFPPNVYGGKEQWVRDFLQKDANGHFPVADKLIEVAQHYGFEGWFINQETHGMTRDDADLMRAFLRYYQQQSPDHIKIMWYDAMLDDGRVIWQEELNDHNEMFFQEGDERISDIMFLDFGWHAINLEDTHKKALSLERSPWELYAGIDVQSRGYQSYARWEDLYAEGGELKNTSIALYWATSSFDLSATKQPEEVYAAEQKFWNGTDIENPPHPRLKRWEGFTGHLPPRSTINSLPFVTRFNYGLGRFYHVDGKRVSDSSWHNMSNQDILPHWQWKTDTSQVLVTFDFEDSYDGGSCLRFSAKGNTDAQYIPLYRVDLGVSPEMQLSTVYKSASITAEITLQFADGSQSQLSLQPEAVWDHRSISLQEHVGKQLKEVGVTIKPGDNLTGDLFLGELRLATDSSRPSRPEATVTFANKADADQAYLHITTPAVDLWYYDVYQVLGKQRRHLKRSSSSSIFIERLVSSDRSFGSLEVVPVSMQGVAGQVLKLRLK